MRVVGTSVALVLGTLVIASFAIGPIRASVAAGRDAPAEQGAAIAVSRAATIARGERVREQPPSIFGVLPVPEPDMLFVAGPRVTPEPTPDPTPEPTPTHLPVVRTTAPRTPAPVPVITTDMSPAEQQMLVLINASRVGAGLGPLAMDAGVARTARLHSLAESQVGYIYHDGPDGTAASRDVPACGSGWYGENTGKIWNGDVAALYREFMNEPWQPVNHRTIIMDPIYARVGIGAVQGRDALYMTMVFCR